MSMDATTATSSPDTTFKVTRYGYLPKKWHRVRRRPLCWFGVHRTTFQHRGVHYGLLDRCAFCLKRLEP